VELVQLAKISVPASRRSFTYVSLRFLRETARCKGVHPKWYTGDILTPCWIRSRAISIFPSCTQLRSAVGLRRSTVSLRLTEVPTAMKCLTAVRLPASTASQKYGLPYLDYRTLARRYIYRVRRQFNAGEVRTSVLMSSSSRLSAIVSFSCFGTRTKLPEPGSSALTSTV
jgi:hypothetical protein